VTFSNLRPGVSPNQRRSQRIVLSLPIQISGERLNGAPFQEATRTLVVNAHGALIHLRERVISGQKLRIKNLATNEELSCEVADINPGKNDVPEIGVAFAEACPRFWRVSFPPTDWSPRNPEAKRRVPSAEAVKPTLLKK
jgi:hypothetical protein